MNNEAQFENILDQAIALLQQGKSVSEITAIYPQYASELRDLLGVAEMVAQAKETPQQKAAFDKTISALRGKIATESNSVSSQYMTIFEKLKQDWARAKDRLDPFKFFSRINPILGKITKVLAVIILVWVVGGPIVGHFVIKRLILATTDQNEASYPVKVKYIPSPPATIGTSGGVKATNFATLDSSSLGLEVSRSMGLGATDVRVSVARLLNPVGVITDMVRSVGRSTVVDTREFLKTDYQATIKTRQVEELGMRAQTIIRGYGGRVDNASLQNRYGSIEFVVPKDEFEAFKRELKSLVRAKFITEGIRQQNLLPEKRGIEQQTDRVTTQLDQLKQDRDDLNARHRQTVNTYNRQIAALNHSITVLQQEATVTTTILDRQAEITQELAGLRAQKRTAERRLATENTNYTRELNSLNYRIRDAETQIADLDTQDQALLATVETVSGTIILEWISLLAIVDLYLPGHWAWWVAGAVIVAYLIRRRRQLPAEPVA
ncbi:MAG: hypothetical protein HYV42_04940 [Candidatus Magasanikbacteria bacterium]|nr:hypothetical protein [Candidatus Magasanikbacteria bacterium]